MNLLRETESDLALFGKTWADVTYIGSSDGEYGLTVDHFQEIADVEYDTGYGAAEVATDLIIAFKDGSFMKRGEYDGSEWWELIQPAPERAKHMNVHTTLTARGWHSMAAVLDREEE